MRLFRMLLLGGLLLSALSSIPARAAPDQDLEAYLRESFDRSAVPGMAVVATRGDEVVFSGGFGEDGDGEPMSARTPLRVASMTKSITSVAVHQLVEKGDIDLDDPVKEHLPEFRLADPRHTEITVQQLLDNRSGMRDDRFDLAALNRSTSLADYVSGLHAADLASDPGKGAAYCNVNWEVLARMVEVVADQPFAEYLDKEVFAPLGMGNSTVDPRTVRAPGGYQEFFGLHRPRADDVLFSASSGSNWLITTAEDLGRWTRWVASGEAKGEVLRPAVRQRILDRALEEDGADGFEARQGRLGKNGMHHTEMSQFLTDPQDRLGVTVVVNSNDMPGPAHPVAMGALDVMAGERPDPVGSGRWVTVGYCAVALVASGLGLLGVRRAGSWAIARVDGRRWVTGLRLLWLLAPTVLLASVPTVLSALTRGTRTVTWVQLTYLALTPLCVLAVVAAAGLGVLAARGIALRSARGDVRLGPQELGGGEPEDGPHRVAEVGG